MKQQLEMTQVGDIPAAMKKWKAIFTGNKNMRKCKEIDNLGAIVFAFAHLTETRQGIMIGLCDEKFVQKLNIPEMAKFVRNRHVCTFQIWSFMDDSISFEVHFVLSKDKRNVEYIVCGDHITGRACVLTDFSILPVVLRDFMNATDRQLQLLQAITAN